MKIFIDGDMLVYRIAFAGQKIGYKVQTKDGILDLANEFKLSVLKKQYAIKNIQEYIIPDEVPFVKHSCRLFIEKIFSDLESKYGPTLAVRFYIQDDAKTNFRYSLAKTPTSRGLGYKAGRPKKPYFYYMLREYLIKEFRAKEVKNIETDDVLGILGTKYYGDCILVHQDKDINQIPGIHYDPVSGIYAEYADPGHISLSNDHKKLTGGGWLFFYAQLLMGDMTDNIPGLPGWGPKSTYEVVSTMNKKENVIIEQIVSLYKQECFKKWGFDYGQSMEYLCEMADLLWILRHKEHRKSMDFKVRSKLC